MKNEKKSKIALQACEIHLQEYEEFSPVIPQRFLDLWSTGEILKYDGYYLPETVHVPTWDPSCRFELRVIAPFWANDALMLDDAVVGPIGDWEHASNYLPFMKGEGFAIVAKLDEENCPVGIFIEGFWNQNKGAYSQGVYKVSSSLNDFLASLTAEAEGEIVESPISEEEAFEELE